MKNNKSHKSDGSSTSFRSSAPAAKTRDGEGSKAKAPFYKGAKAKSTFRSSENSRRDEKPKFGDTAKFGERARAGFRSNETPRRDERPKLGEKAKYGQKAKFGEKSKFGDKPKFGDTAKFGERARAGFRSNETPRRDEKPKFGEKAKYGEKAKFGEKSKFGGKPRFGDKAKYSDKAKPAFRTGAKPAFRKPKPAEKEEHFKPASDCVLIWGLHAARAAFLNPKRRIARLWLTESGQKTFEVTQNEARDELLKRPDAKRLDRDELDRITPPGSVHQGIVIEAAPLADVALHDIIAANPPPDLILLLDQVTDPHNVGAILRSAAAFGAGAIVMTERNAPTTTGVLAKAASGALECTPMIHVVNLARTLDDLREAGYWCVGLAEEGAKNLGALDLSGRTALVLGAEGDGLRHLTRQKCDELARLPTQGPIGSLNVSNAAAVALYEVRKQAK